MRGIAVLWAALLILAGCGGSDEPVEQAAAPASTATTAEPKPHLLSAQQEMMKEAAKVQGKLDEDAQRKREALQNPE
jgi:PBP1b-binding outer membrane lipoprotein LpoB